VLAQLRNVAQQALLLATSRTPTPTPISNRPLAIPKQRPKRAIIARPRGRKHGAAQPPHPPRRAALAVLQRPHQQQHHHQQRHPHGGEDRPPQPLPQPRRPVRPDAADVRAVLGGQGVLGGAGGHQAQVAGRGLGVGGVGAGGAAGRREQRVRQEGLRGGSRRHGGGGRQRVARHGDGLVGRAAALRRDDVREVRRRHLVHHADQALVPPVFVVLVVRLSRWVVFGGIADSGVGETRLQVRYAG